MTPEFGYKKRLRKAVFSSSLKTVEDRESAYGVAPNTNGGEGKFSDQK
jgi:hypothetical protein